MRKTHLGRVLATLTFSIIILMLSGCFKDNFDFDRMREDMITWEPDIAFPVVYSTLNAEEIISLSDSTNIYQYDADNFITLIYRKRIFSQTVNDFFQLPFSQNEVTDVNLDAVEITQFTTNNVVNTSENTTFTFGVTGPGSSQLDIITFQQGTMRIAFTSDFQHSGTLQVNIPNMTLNGNAYSQDFAINYQGAPVSESIDIALAGYQMDLDNGNGANTIPIEYVVTLNQGGGNVPLPTNKVQVTHTFEQMTLAYADGNFGSFVLDVPPAQVDLDVFNGENQGAIYFEDPKFRVRVKNTIGAEMRVDINQLFASGTPGTVNIDVTSEIPGESFLIQAAPSVGDSSVREFFFDQNNSNIKPVVNGQYSDINHDFEALVNPNGPGTGNFAELNSAIEVVADIELPFYGYSDHFTILDTLEVPFNEAEDFADNIERGLLRINTVSHFPVDGLLKLYFADSLYNVLDSVLTDGQFIIRSGEVAETLPFDGNTFKVVNPVQTNNDIELDTTRINSLFASEYLILSTDFTTTNDANDNIKLFADDFIEVRIGLRVKLKASPSDIDDF